MAVKVGWTNIYIATPNDTPPENLSLDHSILHVCKDIPTTFGI
jgi:hypothetical protein